MAFGIGNLGQIVADFTESLNQIFGGGSKSNKTSVVSKLASQKVGGISNYDASKWTGNARIPNSVRYGFAIFNSRLINSGAAIPKETTLFEGPTGASAYYLDIPPQSITQKENFATNIQATRKGIIVETEGVVFKDIIIQGTTGVFPAKRGAFNGPQSQILSGGSITDPPSAPAGVDPATGLSKDSSSKSVSGYAEFLGLRQFFLKYASDKVKANGDLFLIFINEKDNQALIVEPLEFTMERSSKSPMSYNYKITMKAIGTLSLLFNSTSNPNPTDIFSQIGNVAANVAAAVGQGRAAINATATVFRKTFQALDQTVNGPLLQVQMAVEDVSAGIAETLALPATFVRNFNQSTLFLRENRNAAQSALQASPPKSQRLALTANLDSLNSQLATAESTNPVPIPRSFVATTRDTLKSKADNVADSLNLGDPLYDKIKGRTVTENPGPLKTASDDEFLLMGNVYGSAIQLNSLLASNQIFESDAEVAFEQARQAFVDPTVPEANQLVTITKPDLVREVIIKQGDTLEKIASREYGQATRWVELVVINRLKPPYIDEAGGDRVLKPGDKLLVGAQ